MHIIDIDKLPLLNTYRPRGDIGTDFLFGHVHPVTVVNHEDANLQLVDPANLVVKIEGVDIRDIVKGIKTGFLIFGGLVSKCFGMGLIGFLAYQAMLANKSYQAQMQAQKNAEDFRNTAPPHMPAPPMPMHTYQ